MTSARRATTPHERSRDSRCEEIASRGLRTGLNQGASGFHFIDSFREKALCAPNLEHQVSVDVFYLVAMPPNAPRTPDDLTKVKTWLEKPEQAEILRYLREMIRPTLRPELHEEFILKKAQRFLRTTGFQLPGER